MARALVTGAMGFSGRHLARHLGELGWEVIGTHSGRRSETVREPGPSLFRLDPMRPDCVAALLDRVRPDYIFHLAGYTGPCATAADFAALLQSHALATATLLEAMQRLHLGAKVLIPGSSAQFGTTEQPERPVTEDTPYRPLNLYGVAKVAEALAAECWRARGVAVIRTHTFNCIGPGQRAGFVPAAFARQVAAIEKGLAEPILEVGNLSARRDLTDVRDVVRAYVAAATRGEPGAVYNVCSGCAPSVAELIEEVRSLSRVGFELRHDPARLRPADLPVQIGNADRLRRATGWEPAIPLQTSLADVLDDWRARV